MVYICLFLIVIYGVVKYDSDDSINKGKNIYFYFCLLFIILLAGLRYKTGADTINYHYNYSSWPDLSKLTHYHITESRYNILFIYFWSLCKSICSEVWFYQIIHSTIVNTVFLFYFKKRCQRVFLCILFYIIYHYFYYNMEIVRASFSVCCFLLSYDYLLEKKWVKYYLFSIIAIGFHTEAIVLLAFPLFQYLSKKRIDGKMIFITIIVSYMILQMANFIPLVDSVFSSMDLEGGYYLNDRGSNVNAYILSVITIVPPVGILILNVDNRDFKFSWLLFLYIFIEVQTLKYTVFFGRILDFLVPILITALVQTIENRNKVKNNMVIIMCVCSFVFTCFFTYIKNSYYPAWKYYYPYSSILDPKENKEREWYTRDMIINR